jgi:glycosyltransferase involved in cell wall biosynthesis
VVNPRFFVPERRLLRDVGTKWLICAAILRQGRKGIDILLHALAGLRERRGDFHLHIVGDGPRRAEYEGLVRRWGIQDHVTFHGRLGTPEFASLMRNCDLYVLPSLYENFSVATAEALACGVPVLATRCGGPEEFITPQVGMLVPSGDDEALCQGIDYMLDHLSDFSPAELSDYAARRFGRDSVGEQLHAVYEACVKGDTDPSHGQVA